ncbi:MAG: DUF4358 domain-containing protein [Ruminiclostridium sp.]|nr:DUF4358 domain-containing protein [Ruminiclostridium sp.]
MKKIKSSAATLAALLLLSGCGAKAPEKTVIADNTVVTATAPAETSGTAGTGELAKYKITCAEIAYKTLQADDIDYPPYMEVTDETMLSEVMGYDMSVAEDSCVYCQLVSADLFELAVIRASDDNIDAVKRQLGDRRDYLKDQAAFYPAQAAAADATIVSEQNGYCFLICSKDAEAVSKHILYYIMLN